MDLSTRPSRTLRMMTGPCSSSALVSDCRVSTLATRSPAGEITREVKLCTAGTGDGAAAGAARPGAASIAPSKNACIFMGREFTCFRLPKITCRQHEDALRAPLRDGTHVRAALKPAERTVQIEQPVVREEPCGAETHADSGGAGMGIEGRMSRGQRLRRRDAEFALQVAMRRQRDGWTGKHDEFLGTAGKRHVDADVADGAVGAAHQLADIGA